MLGGHTILILSHTLVNAERKEQDFTCSVNIIDHENGNHVSQNNRSKEVLIIETTH